MESPVRIKPVCALTILVLWLTLSIGNGFPTNSVAEEPLIEDSNTNSNHSKFNKTNESIFASRNSSARYLKNSPFRENRYTTAPPIVTQSSIKVFESTTNNPNIANRINFRGSVKYFATRPTYKPKVANPRRNVTRYRHESSDTIKTIVNANKTENLIVREPTEKFTVKKEIKEPTKTIKTDLAQNDKNIKQQNDFNIDRYTSPEFHDINNVYSQSVSPEIQQFIVPGNVSDYFVSVGSSPYVSPADSNSDEDEEEDDYYSNDMTTPKITFFDSKFREVSKQIKQNLADAAFETESSFLEDDKTTTEKMENRMTMDFKELLSRPPNNHTKVMYKNTKEIILTDSQNSLSDHKDLVDMNGTRIFYEMSMVSTEKYDHKSSTMRMLPDSSEENEITTPRPQEKIVAADSMPPEISKRLDRFRSNETRKEYPTTIRMRPPTTPRPRVRISLKTPSTTSPSYESTVGTKTPETVKMIPYSRRLPWLTTVSSKIDPVYQESSGPPKIVGRTRPDSENSIVGLRKRGSNKYSNITSSDTSAQLVIPPTATAWALITLKDTPLGKKNETKEEVSTPVETENPTDLTTTIVKEVLQENTQAPPNKINELAQPKKKIFNNLNNNIIGINSGGGYRTETPDSEENSGEDQTDNVGSNSSFESITKLPSAITTPAYESDAATDSEYFGMTGEDSETERFEVDNEEVTTTDEPTTTIKSSTETTSESIIDLTTLVSKPYARQRTTFSYTTRSPLPSSTTESIKETTISNRRFRTTTNPPEELTTITTTTTTTTDPSYRLSSDWGVANRNQVVSTTTESMDATTVSRNKGTNEDDLEEFTFGTTTMNPVTETTTQTVRNPSQDIEAASTTYYSSSSSLTTTHLSISTTPPFVHTEAPTTVAEDHEESSEVNSEDNDDDEEKHQNEVPTGKNDGGDIIDLITKTVNKDDVDATTSSAFTSPSNIEVIKPYQPESKLKPHERNSNESFVDDMNKFEEMISGSGAIAAIAISAVGFVALILLIGLLIVARGRRRNGGYGQRCTPVSLDSYSLDNVSVGGSTRKARRASKRSYGNPAYDESGATSHPMQFAALANFALDQDSIVSEFNEIPSVTVRADEIPPGCESKNRYSNVIPIPETRVVLSAINGDETSEYINANFVRGPKNMKNYYIACQAPISSTVSDFWRMIWEQNSRVVLMLTELMENGAEKCYEYIPPSEASDNKRVFGDYQITMLEREVRDKYVISHLQLKNLVTKTYRDITHMWYFWPAKGVPDEHHSIIAYLIEARSCLKATQSSKEYDEDGKEHIVEENNQENVYNVQTGDKSSKNGTLKESKKRAGPMVIHCSPGTGRTGTVIACDIGIRDFEISRTVDVPKTVYKIRRDRANAVQTKDQYIFVYKVLSEYAAKLTGGVLNAL